MSILFLQKSLPIFLVVEKICWVNLAAVDFSIFFSLQRNTNRYTYPNTFLIIDKLHTQPMCF